MKVVETVRTEHYIKIRVADTGYKESIKIEQWCQEHHCGKRVALRTYAFQKEEEYSMFLLRWSAETS